MFKGEASFPFSQDCIQRSLKCTGLGSVPGLSSSVQSLSLSITPAQTAAWRKQIFQQLSERTKRELENFRHYEQAVEQVSNEDTYLCLLSTWIYRYWVSRIQFWRTDLNLLSAFYSPLYFCPCSSPAAPLSRLPVGSSLANTGVQFSPKNISWLFCIGTNTAPVSHCFISQIQRNICSHGTL